MSVLPPALIQSLQNVTGFDEEAFQAVHQSGGQITSVRLNPWKIGNRQSAIGNDQQEKIPWSSLGFYLPERPSFTLDPLFHAGAYYVQEASSMFLEEVLKQTVDLTKPIKVLDLCAAPGGKSTLIQSVISNESLLVSNEVIKTRVHILSENMTKWGAANVIVTNNDPKDFRRLGNYFDVIVVDAPCSGSGLFRKDPNAITEWSENNVELCAQRQQRILADVISSLKDGGVLIYSTCSYSPQEDEEICDWMVDDLGLENLPLTIEENWQVVETVSKKENAFGYRFYPDKVKGEGFFITAFRKISLGNAFLVEDKNQNIKGRSKAKGLTANETGTLKKYLKNMDEFYFIKQNEDVIAMPKNLEHDLLRIQSALYIKKAGVRLGNMIRDELIPAHDLAMSIVINPGLPKIEVDKETALQYLRRQEIKMVSSQKGWILLTHQQLPMGWIKVMTNRINNYYPKEWRILNK